MASGRFVAWAQSSQSKLDEPAHRNQLGGGASGTVIPMNRRLYHRILLALIAVAISILGENLGVGPVLSGTLPGCVRISPAPIGQTAHQSCTMVGSSTLTDAPSTEDAVAQSVPTGSPSGAEIVDILSRTIEPGIEKTFTPVGDPLTISDGAGGYLTAVKGMRSTNGTADSTRWLVFFWHNDMFLGWDTAGTSMLILEISSPQDGAFAVTYANYAFDDPTCCASLPPVAVTYQWDGSRLVADGTPPVGGSPVSLTPGP
jgi:hypothetical protein